MRSNRPDNASVVHSGHLELPSMSLIKEEITMTMQAMPIPKKGACPIGYHSDGDMCMPDPGAKPAMLKAGSSSAPIGWHTEGDYIVADSTNPRNVIPKTGSSCPLGYHTDGDYYVQN